MEKCKKVVKPPLGLMPKNIWIYLRKKEILLAMDRYIEANEPVPEEWIEELRQLNNQNI